jgi:cyclic pyranopterin phosphate synthase
MPEKGIPLVSHDDILSYEEIARIVEYAANLEVDKVRITGGEPLVRKGIVDLVSMLSAIGGITDLSTTTNGYFLEELAAPLKRAGLHRVNVSLDALDAKRYSAITRGGDVTRVLTGICAAEKAGLLPIKLNCVVKESSAEPDARAVARFAEERGFKVQFIRRMEISKGKFWAVEGGTGGDCAKCNRLRLTSNGELKPCLFSDVSFNIRELGMEEAFRRALEEKPETGRQSNTHEFYNIGG